MKPPCNALHVDISVGTFCKVKANWGSEGKTKIPAQKRQIQAQWPCLHSPPSFFLYTTCHPVLWRTWGKGSLPATSQGFSLHLEPPRSKNNSKKQNLRRKAATGRGLVNLQYFSKIHVGVLENTDSGAGKPKNGGRDYVHLSSTSGGDQDHMWHASKYYWATAVSSHLCYFYLHFFF